MNIEEPQPPLSNLPVPPEQCAVHILGIGAAFSFYVNGSHEYRARESEGSTLLLESGQQLIEVGRAWRLRTRKTDALTAECSAGGTTFIQVESSGGFSKPTLRELLAEEAQPIISKITSNSK